MVTMCVLLRENDKGRSSFTATDLGLYNIKRQNQHFAGGLWAHAVASRSALEIYRQCLDVALEI